MADIVKLFIISSLCICLAVESTNAKLQRKRKVSQIVQTVGAPWPMPQKYVAQLETLSVRAESFSFLAGKITCSILDEAFKRYYQILFGRSQQTLFYKQRPVHDDSELNELVVDIQTPCSDDQLPEFESDESYQLEISDGEARLSSNEIWGALRGLETFSQLIYQDDTGKFLVNGTSIVDYPRFPHRGLLLDTSRHFISVPLLLHNLDAMSQNKYNVFHWHIVDDPAFPYESSTFPDLARKGAYNHNTHVYSQSDVRTVIEYARVRGIRVIPEFDTPGHTQSWGNGQPDLLTKCYTGGQPNGLFGPINPVPNTTYTFLTQILKEVSQVFPDHYMHLGGDEVSFTCWESNPELQDFVQREGFTSYSQVEQYYMQKLLDIVGELGKGYQIYQEVIDNGVQVKPDTVIDIWKAGWQAEMSKVTGKGYKTLLSSCWYLSKVYYGPDWINFYSCEPHNFTGSESQKKLVQGGETCLWGEFVDEANLMSRLWPRAAASGERLWSDMSVNNIDAAQSRLAEHRCRMVRRGFQAEPITGPGYCKTEY